MTVLLHTARISTVEFTMSSDMWMKMVNFVLGNKCERWVNLHDAWWCLHVYMYETRLSIYTLTWNKILWLFPDLVKNLISNSGNSKTNQRIVLLSLYYLGPDWPNGALQYAQAHYCKSAIEQTWTWSVKLQCTPTVQVASVAFSTKKSKVDIIMSYSFFFFQNPTWLHPVKKDF